MLAPSEREQFLEREDELAALGGLLDAAVGGHGGVAVIEGPAGIGKTRLLAETCRLAVARGMTLFRARGSDVECEFAFGVVRQLFEAVVRREGPQRAALFDGVTALAAPVFSGADPAAESGAGPTGLALDHALFWLAANLADRRPMLVAIDDAHWADEASLRFLHFLTRRAGELPVAVVLAARPSATDTIGQLVTRISSGPGATVLRLHALSAVAARELVRSLVTADADERVWKACYAATGGNPLLLRELAGAIKDAGVPASPAELDGVGRLVPEAVVRHMLVRLARTPPGSVALARAAALLGDGADPGHAAALAGLDDAGAAEAFDALVAADILTRHRPLQFVHPLLREVVLSEFAPAARRVAHRRAARLLADAGAEPQRVASQLLAGDPVRADWAREILRAAARDANERGTADSAVLYLERALMEACTTDERAAVLLELGLAEAAAGRPASEHLSEALQLTTDPTHRARIAPNLAMAMEYAGRPAAAAHVLEAAIDDLGTDHSALRLALEAQAVVAANTFLEARTVLRDRVGHARAQLPHLTSPAARPLLAGLSQDLSRRGGTAEQATACAERALTGEVGVASLWDGIVVVVAAESLSHCGWLSRARAVLDDLVARARARGATQTEIAALTGRAVALNRAGRLLEGEADARLALELAEHRPGAFLRPYLIAQLADSLIERGQLNAAAQLLTSSELASHESDQTYFQTILHDTRARLLARQGRIQDAIEACQTVRRGDLAWDVTNPGWTSWRSTLSVLHHRLGDSEQAAALADEQLRAARAFGAPDALGVALRTAGLVSGRAGIEQLREAVAVLEGSEARLEHARALVTLGAALRGVGYRLDARVPLRAGLELADRCGAGALAEHARRELLATGARPRRPRTSGRDALTPSEMRIAGMAAEGVTNREIAQALYLSPKTVEMHLSHIFGKLGIASRQEISRALADPTP